MWLRRSTWLLVLVVFAVVKRQREVGIRRGFVGESGGGGGGQDCSCQSSSSGRVQ